MTNTEFMDVVTKYSEDHSYKKDLLDLLCLEKAFNFSDAAAEVKVYDNIDKKISGNKVIDVLTLTITPELHGITLGEYTLMVCNAENNYTTVSAFLKKESDEELVLIFEIPTDLGTNPLLVGDYGMRPVPGLIYQGRVIITPDNNNGGILKTIGADNYVVRDDRTSENRLIPYEEWIGNTESKAWQFRMDTNISISDMWITYAMPEDLIHDRRAIKKLWNYG